jgi:lysophospholipase L1-like esterase
MKRIVLIFAFALACMLSFAQAPQRGAGAQDFQQMRRMMDWAGFNRYAEANKEVTQSPLVIFMGDSITDFWGQFRPDFFSDHNYLCRGIGAQTVEHMLSRFHADVVDLHPKAVTILAGINNIAGNNGKISFENIVGCIASMCETAKANNIVPVICSILPCDRFSWNPEAKPAQDVVAVNDLLKEYARKAGVAFVDYYTPMAQPDGSLPAELSQDGCHPTVAGYEVMEGIIVPELERILAAAAAPARPAAPAGPARQAGPSDWGNFKRYEAANAEITSAPLVVLMGDSITDYWYDTDPDFFTRNNFVGRGIAGQTASQMLVRFKQDVVNLHPKAVAIMAGTNDLCQNMMGQSYYPDQTIIDNTVAMCELAEAAGIKVLLCSITPVAHYMPIPDQDAGTRIVALNQRLKAYADSHKNVTYVDYHTPLADEELGLPETGSYDGVHPAVNLYDDMERILVDSVRKVLKLKKQEFYTLPSDEADRRKVESDADRKARNMPMNFKGMVEMMSRMRMR